jgi:hypothetical protein
MLAQGRIALDMAIPDQAGQEEMDAILHRLEGDQNLPLEDLAEFVR